MEELNFENMDMADLISKLNDIEEYEFMLEMKDHWEHGDFELKNKYNLIKKQIEEEIEKRRNEDGK